MDFCNKEKSSSFLNVIANFGFIIYDTERSSTPIDKSSFNQVYTINFGQMWGNLLVSFFEHSTSENCTV